MCKWNISAIHKRKNQRTLKLHIREKLANSWEQGFIFYKGQTNVWVNESRIEQKFSGK